MHYLLRALLAILVALTLIAPAFALDLGSNITIYDENSSTDSGWYSAQEDDEVEPGMVGDQKWDLEGFFLEKNSLSMVGGYNFADGYGGYTTGDIFLSTSTPTYGPSSLSGVQGNVATTWAYGYNYVLDLNVSSTGQLILDGAGQGNYQVFLIDDSANLLTAKYLQNEGSSPWQYEDGGALVDAGSFSFFENVADTGFAGDTHYLLTGFDLSFLGHGTEFYSHFTMGCGNDNLMGQGTVVPEPSTFLLFGVGAGLVWLTRRRKL